MNYLKTPVRYFTALVILSLILSDSTHGSVSLLPVSDALPIPTTPTILSARAESRHFGGIGSDSYGVYLVAHVSDPNGLSDIASVTVEGPTGISYTLTDPNSDGWYDLSNSLTQPPATGTYKFKVTDRSSLSFETNDEITAILDYPHNVIPQNGSVVNTASPVFSWSAVTGATSYSVSVCDNNGNYIWNRDNIPTSSVTFNDNGTATGSLVAGSNYSFQVACFDANGNQGGLNSFVRFAYSVSSTIPVIVNQSANTGHYGNDTGYNVYYAALSADVFDPQGLNDISSVTVSGPSGFTATLDDPEHDGTYVLWHFNSGTPPATGNYVFRVTDKEGNWRESSDNISGSLGFPANLQPHYNEIITTSIPTFRWDAVTGASYYDVWIIDHYGSQIWYSGNIPTNSVIFNFDGQASSALIDGSIYSLNVRAVDAEHNWGEHNNRRFVYSTNASKPVAGSFNIVSYHGGNGTGTNDYGYDANIDVVDPQGLSDIASVTIKTPDGNEYPLADDNSDGNYNAWIRGISVPSTTGICTFTIKDRSNNTTTAQDNLTRWMSIPQNTRPSSNEFVASATPVFSWDAVDGTNNYQVNMWSANNDMSWNISVSGRTSVTYNENGTGPALILGKKYFWELRCYDSDGNYGYRYSTDFYHSSSTTAPIIMDQTAFSGIYGDDNGSYHYRLFLEARVADPQGASDISSVTVKTPDNKTHTLLDNNGDGLYETSIYMEHVSPVLGSYTFKVTDKSANTSEANDQLTAVFDYPKNISPAENAVVSSASPVFSWTGPAGAKHNIWIYDINGRSVWSKEFTSTSVTFNDDGKATQSLTDGSSYTYSIRVHDDDRNFGEQSNNWFTYSIDPSKPVTNRQYVRSRMWTNAVDLNSYWGIDAGLLVADPQGANDIDSVWIDGPSNFHKRMYDDATYGGTAGDGFYNFNTSQLTAAPATGEYIFKAKDKSGNISVLTKNLNAVLSSPSNVLPKHNIRLSDQNFTISWDQVTGATRYVVYISNYLTSSRIWELWLTQNSTTYNSDGTGAELVDGDVISISVQAHDADDNTSQMYGIKIAYRLNNRKTVYVDSLNITGTEHGTKTSPFNNLDEGISASIPEDTIIVAKGTYSGFIMDIGAVTLLGENPVNTIINGFIAFRSGSARVSGFKISNPNGTAVEVHENVNAVISGNIISGSNTGITQGWDAASTTVISNNTIVGNTGPAIAIDTDGSDAKIFNNIFSNNNTGIRKNSANATVSNTYNDYFSNTTDLVNLVKGKGELTLDPKFTDYTRGKYSLTALSACIDAGDPDSPFDPDTTRSDMGALYMDQRTLIPTTPEGLTALSCNDSVTLKWKKNKGLYFHHYSIVGGLTENPTTQIGIRRKVADTVLTIKLDHGKRYYFKVKTVNRGGAESNLSSQVSETIQTGVLPKIKTKWNEVLICYNIGDSLTEFQWYKNGNALSGATGQYLVTDKTGTYYVAATDIRGCTNKSRIVSLSGKGVSLFPNPVSEYLTFSLDEDSDGEANITIMNSSGIRIREFQTDIVNNSLVKNIHVGDLQNGIYYIRVTVNNERSYTGKFVVTK